MSSAVAFTKVLDEARWGKEHWKLFTIVSLNYLLDGVMFSIAPLLVAIVAPEHYPVIFAANLLAETAGAVVLGRLADVYGRRVMFMVSLALEVLALILLIPLYENVVALAVLTALFPMIPTDVHWLLLLYLAAVGFCTYGPDMMMCQTMAMDIATRKATATAGGFIDAAGSLGAALTVALSGYLVDVVGWNQAMYLWAAGAAPSTMLPVR